MAGYLGEFLVGYSYGAVAVLYTLSLVSSGMGESFIVGTGWQLTWKTWKPGNLRVVRGKKSGKRRKVIEKSGNVFLHVVSYHEYCS